uniref:CSON015280 protein n=1 Tax=Culicoides sonorensis TaxID=179676 RepID=A0A336KSQ6_CULSO
MLNCNKKITIKIKKLNRDRKRNSKPKTGLETVNSGNRVACLHTRSIKETNIIQGIAIEKCTKSYENGDIVKKAFQLPSHCKCPIRRPIYNSTKHH